MEIGTLIKIIAIIAGALIVGIPAIMNYFGWISISKQQEKYQESFDKTIDQLSSDKMTAQLSAAVLLRRFFKIKLRYHFFTLKKIREFVDNKFGKKISNEEDVYFLRKETINVISSLLKTLPTGVYQKTLADGLSSCDNLSDADLQYANLQNAFLGTNDENNKIILNGVDFFCANLTKALIKNITARNCYFINAILCNTRFKNCDLSNTSFQGADLTNIFFQKVVLCGADFNGAYNIPPEIEVGLKEGKFISSVEVTTAQRKSNKKIFFSMPGSVNNDESQRISAYRAYLVQRGFEVVDYKRDHYPHFGQLTAVKSKIAQCVGMIVFGSRQILIKEGVYRPNLLEEKKWENEWLSTSWNEIEVGMGIMIGLPILLIQEAELKTGIFDTCLSESILNRTSSMIDLRKIEDDENFNDWLSKLPMS